MPISIHLSKLSKNENVLLRSLF